MDKSVRMSSELWKKIKTCATKEKRTLKMVLEIAVCRYLQKKVLEK